MLSALFHNHQKHDNINETRQQNVIEKRLRFEKISNRDTNISRTTTTRTTTAAKENICRKKKFSIVKQRTKKQ